MRLALIAALLLCGPLWAAEEVQTDTLTTVQAACGVCATNGCDTASLDGPRTMDAGATPGSTSSSETHPAATNDLMLAFFEDVGGLGAACDAGTATTRLNVTTANTNITVTEICICQATTEVGSATGLSIALSAGVKTQTVTTSSVAGCASGAVRVIYCGNTGGLHGNESYAFTPDQDHTIPTTAPTGQFPVRRRILGGP